MSAALVALELALLATTGLVVGRSAARRAASALLVLACLAVPLALPPSPTWLRFALALGSQISALRVIEVLRDARAHGPALRVFAFLAPLDALAIRAAPKALDRRALAIALVTTPLTVLSYLAAIAAPAGAWHRPALLAAGVVLVYAASDAASAILRLLLRAVGITSPLVQDHPIASRTVAEFWGRRWNRAVGSWLRKQCFAPLARRGRVGLGVLAAFVASAWIHFWPVLVSVGLGPALSMGAFFLVQAGLVAVEAKLGVARWRAPLAHAWTVTVLLASSPLFVLPILLVLGIA